MVGIGRSKLFGVALVFAGTLAVISYLTGWILPRSLPGAVGSSNTESDMLDASIVLEKQKPLDCRLVPLEAAERKAIIKRDDWLRGRLQERPDLATPHLFRNPLIVGRHCAKVEIENTSGHDFAIYPYGGDLFWIWALPRNSAGEPTSFGTFTHLSGRMVPLPMVTRKPAEVLKPGQVVSQPLERLFGLVDEVGALKPGKYTIQAVCEYFQAPDAEDCKVVSWPLPLTITDEDVKEWKELHNDGR